MGTNQVQSSFLFKFSCSVFSGPFLSRITVFYRKPTGCKIPGTGPEKSSSRNSDWDLMSPIPGRLQNLPECTGPRKTQIAGPKKTENKNARTVIYQALAPMSCESSLASGTPANAPSKSTSFSTSAGTPFHAVSAWSSASLATQESENQGMHTANSRDHAILPKRILWP